MTALQSNLESLAADVRYGLRFLFRNPGFTAVAVLSLGLVISANTTVFSFLNAMLFRTSLHEEPERLVSLQELNLARPEFPRNPTFPAVVEWNGAARSLEGIGMVAGFPVTLSTGNHAETGIVQWVSPNLFPLLGVAPQMGRQFTPEDAPFDKGEAVILSDAYWQSRFGGDPDVLGQRMIVAGTTATIVGVMPPGFWIYPWSEDRVDVWQAFNINRNLYAPVTRWFTAIGRLKPGATIEQARLELTAINQNLPERSSAEGEWRVQIESLQEHFFAGWEETFYLLFAVSLFVLLIGCVNVANMLLARAARREKEIAVRLALGAGRRRLVRQLLTESLLLSALGGIAGLILTFWGIRLFVYLAPEYWSLRAGQISMDGRVLGFALLISLLTGIILGLVPAVRCSRADLVESLKKGSRQSTGSSHPRLRAALIVSEISLALALLVGAGLMVNSFIRLHLEDPGFDPTNLLDARIFLWGPRYWDFIGGDVKRVEPGVDRFFDELVERVEALPGVIAATSRGGTACSFKVLQSATIESGQESTTYYSVDDRYFRTLGIPLLKGRGFTRRDTGSSRWVTVINETLARRFFPDEDPMGQLVQITFGGERLGISTDEGRPREIVGVVTDEKSGLGRRPRPALYVPRDQHISELPGATYMSVVRRSLLVRTASNPLSLAPSIERTISEIDSTQTASGIETVEQRLSDSIQYWRFWMRLFLFSAALAVVLVVVGVFGVLSYTVSERTHEIGVRMAIGAPGSRVMALVIGDGLKLTLVGLAIGIGLSLALSRLISSYLFGVSPNDPATFAGVALLLIGVVLGASYPAARKATRINPVIALRSE